MNGQALNMFGAGRYTLETQNIPKIGKVLNRTTGDQTPFHCEVYFINKTEQMSIKWGTDSKVTYVESTYGFPIAIGASGEMSLRAEDSCKLLLKLVGTENFLGQQKLVSFFRAFLMTRVKTYMAQYMKNNAISVFEIDEYLTAFSEALHTQLTPRLCRLRYIARTLLCYTGRKARRRQTVRKIQKTALPSVCRYCRSKTPSADRYYLCTD